jgi:hypothetical protein
MSGHCADTSEDDDMVGSVTAYIDDTTAPRLLSADAVRDHPLDVAVLDTVGKYRT